MRMLCTRHPAATHVRVCAFRTPKLRRAIGARLHARHVPRLEFRLDAPSAEEAAMEATFERLAAERKADEAREAARAAAGAGRQ